MTAQVEEAQAEGEKQVGELDKQEQENNDEREALLQQELEIFAAKLNASVRAPCLFRNARIYGILKKAPVHMFSLSRAWSWNLSI